MFAWQYEGEYRQGIMDGRGTYRFADGSVYMGEYKAGKREGRGVYRFADGAVYEGEYKNGAMEGFGTYQYVDGRAEVGRYAGNVDVGEGVRWSADRLTCWRLMDGKVVEEISLDTGDRIARKIGKTRLPEAPSAGQSASPCIKSGHSSGSSRRLASGGSQHGTGFGKGLTYAAAQHGVHHPFQNVPPTISGAATAAPTKSGRTTSSGRISGARMSNSGVRPASGGGLCGPGSKTSSIHGSRGGTPNSRATRNNPLGGGARPMRGANQYSAAAVRGSHTLSSASQGVGSLADRPASSSSAERVLS